MADLGISEALKVKPAVLLCATEAAEMILRVWWDHRLCPSAREKNRMWEHEHCFPRHFCRFLCFVQLCVDSRVLSIDDSKLEWIVEYVFFSLAFLGLILKFKMMEIKVRVSEESLAHSRAHSHLLLPSLAYSRYIYNPSSSLLSRFDVTREFRRSFHLSSNLSVPLCVFASSISGISSRGAKSWAEMGAYCNDDLSLTFSPHGIASPQDVRLSKHVYDNVHGNIYLDPVHALFLSICFPVSCGINRGQDLSDVEKSFFGAIQYLLYVRVRVNVFSVSLKSPLSVLELRTPRLPFLKTLMVAVQSLWPEFQCHRPEFQCCSLLIECSSWLWLPSGF